MSTKNEKNANAFEMPDLRGRNEVVKYDIIRKSCSLYINDTQIVRTTIINKGVEKNECKIPHQKRSQDVETDRCDARSIHRAPSNRSRQNRDLKYPQKQNRTLSSKMKLLGHLNGIGSGETWNIEVSELSTDFSPPISESYES